MYTEDELRALKSSAQVATAIAATASNTPYASSNSDVATNLSIKRWLVVRLRQLYHKART